MKKNNNKRFIAALLVFLIIVLTATPAFAASATVNVRFVVKNQTGPYENVSIQFGKTTKTTGKDGTCQFHLEKIPVTTLVHAFLVDPNVPSGYHSDVHLALGAHEDVKVNSTAPGACSLNIMFTEYTETIVIEYFADNQANYGYSSATFEQKTPAPTQQPQQQPPQQQPPQQQEDPPPDADAPDMHPDDFHEEFPEDFDPDMHPEEFHEEFPEEFYEEFPEGLHEGFNPDEQYEQMGGYIAPRISNTVLIFIIVGGIILLAGVIILIVVLASNKKKGKAAPHPPYNEPSPYNTQPPYNEQQHNTQPSNPHAEGDDTQQ